MVVLHKITWKEFERIIQIIKEHKENKTADWYCQVLNTFKSIKKQNKNIEINITEFDFRKIATILDNWNLIIENTLPVDKEIESIANKLKKSYYQNYLKKIYDEK